MTTTTQIHTRPNDTLASVVGLVLLWLVPAIAFIVALFFV